MEDVTDTAGWTEDTHDTIRRFPTEAEMNIYILTMMCGGTKVRAEARRLFNIIRTFKRDEWRMVNVLRSLGITKTRKMISKMEKLIEREEAEVAAEMEAEMENIRG